jgi:hypothetical protein
MQYMSHYSVKNSKVHIYIIFLYYVDNKITA